MEKEPSEQKVDTESERRFNLLVGVLCSILILAHFVSSFFPKSRLWGINHLAYFPLWVRLIFTLLGLLILVPLVNSRVYKLLEQILSFFQRILPKREVLTASLLAVIAMFFFWLLRTRTHFLGDGALVISLLEKGQLFVKGSEPLEILSHLYLYKFLKLFFTPSAEAIYTALSILAGGAFVIILFFLTKTLSEDRLDRLFTFCIFLFAGTTQLFLGYAEHYTLTYVSILTYLYFSIRYLQGKVKIYLPILLCALSMSLHFSAAVLLPSLLFLFALKRKKGELAFSIKKAIPYFIALIFLLALSIYYIWSFNPALSQIFVPLFKGRVYAPDYTLFSFSHILDIINQHSLLLPVGVILLFSLVLVFKNSIDFKNPAIIFLAIGSVAQVSYQFFVDPALGAARDWDLFSSVALGYTFLGIYLILRCILASRYSKVVLVFTAFLSILPWFILNANTERTIARFRDLLDLDLKKSTNGRYTLINYYAEHSEFAEAVKIKLEIFRLFPEDSLIREAQKYVSNGSYDTALVLLNKVIQLNPALIPAYNELGNIYLYRGETDKALKLFQELSRTTPYSAGVHQNLAKALIAQGRFEEGLKEASKAVKLGAKDASVYTDIANANARLGDMEKALKAYKKAIKLDPTFWVARLNLGQLYLRLNSVDEAQDEFEQVLKLKPSHLPVYYYLGVTYSYKGMKDRAIESFELFLKSSPETPQKQQARTWLKQLQAQKN